MLLSLIRYIRGYLRISIIGYSPERFLNLCSRRHIYLWGLRPCGNHYEMYISVAGFRKLKPIIRKTTTKVVILNRYGLPFFLHKYRNRKVFLAGAVGCMAFLYLMSCFVWNIHIEGNYTRTDETILAYLEKQNVYHGMRKSKINCAQIAKDIRKEFNDIIWVSASVEGTRLMIDVKENTDTITEKVKKEEKATDLIASKDGEVVKIITRNGTPVVEPGDKVKKGDLLVSGRVEIKNDAKEVIDYRYQAADADVYIRTKVSYEDTLPFVYEKKIYTDRERKSLLFRTENYTFHPVFFQPKYKYSEALTTEKQLKLGEHFYFPFSYGIQTVREYQLKKERRSKEEVQKILSGKFQMFCRDLEKKGVEIVEKNVKIYNETQSAKAKGVLILLQKADERQETEVIPIEKKEEIPEGVN